MSYVLRYYYLGSAERQVVGLCTKVPYRLQSSMRPQSSCKRFDFLLQLSIRFWFNDCRFTSFFVGFSPLVSLHLVSAWSRTSWIFLLWHFSYIRAYCWYSSVRESGGYAFWCLSGICSFLYSSYVLSLRDSHHMHYSKLYFCVVRCEIGADYPIYAISGGIASSFLVFCFWMFGVIYIPGFFFVFSGVHGCWVGAGCVPLSPRFPDPGLVRRLFVMCDAQSTFRDLFFFVVVANSP